MAKLFLSYSRKDEARARRLTEWLERKGHDVWRDEDDIGGGTSFSSEIEKALKECDAVLVLWSADSVQSAWVRDEAGYGRDAGKLIPISLDRTDPPLGFRQFQALALQGWKGHGDPPNADRIRQSIARVANLPPIAPLSPQARGWRRVASRNVVLAGNAVALVAATLAFLLWQGESSGQGISIVVLASQQSPDRAMATDYANVAAADMAAFLPRRFDRATVIAPAEAQGRTSAYRMEISTDPHGAGTSATLTLSDKDDQTTLWSRNWSVPDASAADLKAQVSAAASKAALCLTDAKGGSNRLSQPALALYLAGCTDLGDTKVSDADVEGAFERITKLAPSFGPAWDYLALSRSWIAESLRHGPPATYAAAVQRARETIRQARKLNPSSAMTYDAEYHLISDDPLRGLEVLENGAKVDPDDGRIQMHLSEEFLSVGRTSDAVQAAQRGVELEPGAPYTTSQYIQALAYAGEFSKAKSQIVQARQKWPNDPAIDYAEYTYQFRYGDPRAALSLMPRLGDFTDAQMAPSRLFIAARLDPTPPKIDDALAALRARAPNDPRNRNPVLIALADFGRTEEAYQLLNDPTFLPRIEGGLLFRPEFTAIRADPQFMRIAARLGLVRYWRKTGYWPDFCSTERLRYDCKSEATKYPN